MTTVQPKIRSLQAAREKAGYYSKVEAVGFTVYKAQEGISRPTLTPLVNYWYEGSKYTNLTYNT